uniref:hypothetical protein n=1 Tax=Parasphingorhabdus sp. TaxID=2709688 RepID=UPI003A8E60BA
PTPTPTPTPTPPPVLAASDGVRPDGSSDDSIIAFAKITKNGLDQDVTLIFENDEFVGYRMRSGFEFKFDDRDEAEKGGDQGMIGWSRLVGGTKALGAPRGQNSGDHFVYGAPLINRPATGLVTYDLIGYTSPTIRDDSVAPGSFDGSLAVSFGATDIFMGLDATVLFSSDVYNIQTVGGLAAPSIRVSPDGRFGGAADLPDGVGIACNQGDCGFVFNGFLAGDAASHAGLAYTIRDDRANDVSKWIDGSAAFRKAGDGGGAPPPPPSGTVRANQFVAYAAGSSIGIDAREIVDVTYSDTSGAPIGYVWKLNEFTAENERPTIGTAKAKEAGSVGAIIGWTRWADGKTGGRFYREENGIDFGPNQGFHLISGTPATNLPTTGTVTYELVGSTNPTIRDGSLAPGSFTGNLAIAFGATPLVGLDFNIDIGGNSYGFGTVGGAADPGNGGRPVETSGEYANTFGSGQETFLVSGSGPICGGSGDCTAIFRGFLAGDAASHVGISYTFGNGSFDQRVDGVAAFGVPGFSPTATSNSLDDWSSWTAGTHSPGSTSGFGQLSHILSDNRFEMLTAESRANFREILGTSFSFK